VLALKLLPLAAFLPGLRARHVRTALWLGFLLMPYFVWSVLGAMAPGSEGALALLACAADQRHLPGHRVLCTLAGRVRGIGLNRRLRHIRSLHDIRCR